ncbi:hypothetical protein RF11_10850 [Thelohanellus kitauei]|uniref:Uncharacterized protein n=1 Tax=Thelohanellus kitauei TaxID=669202 RepID=A0A0C2NIB4_THEKT|nr:hypothetical protein RF11_10850 [Thelohanellus kitauei]
MNVENVRSGPIGRYDYSIASVNNHLIIYGGYSFFSKTRYNELWMYNTIDDTWIRYEAPLDTSDRSISSAICAVGNFVYIFVGKKQILPSQETNSLLMFNINSATWQTLSVHTNGYDTNGPPPMYDIHIFYHNDSLYIIGGFIYGPSKGKMFKFSLKTSKWTLVPQNGPKLSATKQISTTVFKNK